MIVFFVDTDKKGFLSFRVLVVVGRLFLTTVARFFMTVGFLLIVVPRTTRPFLLTTTSSSSPKPRNAKLERLNLIAINYFLKTITKTSAIKTRPPKPIATQPHTGILNPSLGTGGSAGAVSIPGSKTRDKKVLFLTEPVFFAFLLCFLLSIMPIKPVPLTLVEPNNFPIFVCFGKMFFIKPPKSPTIIRIKLPAKR